MENLRKIARLLLCHYFDYDIALEFYKILLLGEIS